jgi:hypothetical protein
VYAEDNGVTKAFRNLPGVELANVERLNLLQLAPGGHLGRFIIWTRAAFNRLNAIYGSVRRQSTTKVGYFLPRNIMTNSDVTRLINSDEVQSKVRAPIKGIKRQPRKKNPLRNLGALVKLNPYALSVRRSEIQAERRRAVSKATALQAAREKKALPETVTQKNKAAIARTHEPQQRENYKRLIQGDEYKRPESAVVKIQKPRSSVKGDTLKKSTAKKAKKVRAKKVEEVKEVKAVVVPTGPIKKVKAPKEIRVKKASKPKTEKPKKGAKAEAGKAEDPKKGGKDAPKEEAKKGGKKK